MLAAATLGALGAQLAEIRAAKQDWFVVAGRVDKQDISLEADCAVAVRRQQPFDKALRNFPKMDSPPKAMNERSTEMLDYEAVTKPCACRAPGISATSNYRCAISASGIVSAVCGQAGIYKSGLGDQTSAMARPVVVPVVQGTPPCSCSSCPF